MSTSKRRFVGGASASLQPTAKNRKMCLAYVFTGINI